MKACTLLIGILLLHGHQVLAQQQLERSASSNTDNVLRAEQLATPDSAATRSDVIVKKKFRFSGPLVRPFKAKKVKEVPRKFLEMINPFARSEPKEGLENLRDLCPRAWSSTVGWSTGAGFRSPVNHESQMNLISVNRTEKTLD